jgi:hypothetical protein
LLQTPAMKLQTQNPCQIHQKILLQTNRSIIP